MIDNCYTFKELKNKFGWETTLEEIKKQITFAKKRGVEIKVAFKKGPTYFMIVEETLDPNEEWRRHPKDEYDLEVSNLGHVRNANTKALIGSVAADGYVKLKRNGVSLSVHRLVMETFNPIENSHLYYVDHIDGQRSNNKLTNLRWVTATENILFRNNEWQELSPLISKLIQKYGYEGAKQRLELFLDYECSQEHS